jgi:CO/xanthine dehydrogenase Mo-binding subunit
VHLGGAATSAGDPGPWFARLNQNRFLYLQKYYPRAWRIYAVVWAARRLKRSLRWTAERSEGFVSDAQGRDNYTIVELGTDKEGRFLALRVTTWANMGAYLSNFGPFIPQLAAPMLSGVYRIPAIHLNIKGTLTNTVPVDAYRGAGRPEAIYLLERTIDVAARELERAQTLSKAGAIADRDVASTRLTRG